MPRAKDEEISKEGIRDTIHKMQAKLLHLKDSL